MGPAEASTEPEVCEFDVATLVNQDIIWLDITMDETDAMDAVNGQHQLRNVEQRTALKVSGDECRVCKPFQCWDQNIHR